MATDGTGLKVLVPQLPEAHDGYIELCSIVFHLLVPGGKWLTWIVSPRRSAMPCNSAFHARERWPLLPPASAVMKSSFVDGYTP